MRKHPAIRRIVVGFLSDRVLHGVESDRVSPVLQRFLQIIQ
ncbi:MAG TPA: hypothetical protein V6C91_18345 [Coleofasciculaceae cyanobacterium]